MNLTSERFGRTCRRWHRDERGASMVTTALTLPLLIIFLVAVWYVFIFLAVKVTLHLGVQDAARYLSEEGRYWNIDPNLEAMPDGDPHNDVELYPEEFWTTSAKRVVANRLRMLTLPQALITETLFVTVTTPLLALDPNSGEQPIEEGFFEQMCDPTNRDEEMYRHWENIRFLVYASYKVPFWQPTIPWKGGSLGVTLHDRSVGYVQCPRWYGMADGTDPDKSRYLAREGPYLKWRNPIEAPAIITVTVDPNATPRPTATSMPSPTRRPSATPPTPAPEP